MSKNKKLFLLDAHALCYRAFFAIRSLTNSKGQATNAVFGFINILRKILKDFEPDYMAVCFDSKEKTKRQEKYAEYKIQRPRMPDDLISQIPIIKNVVQAFGISLFEMGGYEADDLIATIAQKAPKGIEVVIVSEDKDLYQISTPNVAFYSVAKGVLYDKEAVEKKLGFLSQRIVDFLALAGDQSDNIPGVDGIGEVTARKLISEFGSLEAIYKSLDDVKPLRIREKLESQKSEAFLSRELALLDYEAPIEFDVESLKISAPDRKHLFEISKEMEFKRLAEEFSSSQESSIAVKVRSLTKKEELKNLLEIIRKKKQLTLILNQETSGDLFSEKKIAVTTDGMEVSIFPLDFCVNLKEVLADTAIEKVIYDVKSLLSVVETEGCELKGSVFDVMLAGYLLTGKSTIDDFVWEYWKVSLPQEDKLAFEAAYSYKLGELMRKDLKEKSLTKLYEDVELPLSFVLWEMQKTGVCLDEEFLSELSIETGKKIAGLMDRLFEMAGEEFNINSPKQLGVVLFEKLKLPVLKKTKTGFSTDEEVLLRLAEQHDFPSLILEYRQLAKLKSTYIDALPKLVNPKTGRLHAEFDQIGAETGRLSSRNPNLQNIPIRTEYGRQIRKAIIPSAKNRVILAADYSQIELRILAHLSGDKNLIAAFKRNEDIHRYTSSLIFDVDEKDVTKDMRYSAKRINFGIVYGMSTFGLSKDLGISPKEAEKFIQKYFERYPGIKQYMDEQIKFCQDNGYVVTLLNRRRYIPEIKSANFSLRQFAERQAINTPVQGSAADLIKMAMIRISEDLKNHDFKTKMIMTVHDELVFDALKSELKEVMDLIKKSMEQSMKLSVPLLATMQYGPNWLEMTTTS